MKQSALDIYKSILNGELDSFPKAYWRYAGTIKNAIICTKYLIEEYLRWNDEDIKKKLCKETFTSNHLSDVYMHVFMNNTWTAINTIYTGRFREWELHDFPNDKWNVNMGIKAIKWMINKKLKWSDDEIKTNLFEDTFKDYNLAMMLETVFFGDIYVAVNITFPGRFEKSDLLKYKKNLATT